MQQHKAEQELKESEELDISLFEEEAGDLESLPSAWSTLE